MKFIKMHGCGNDYVFVDCFREKYPPDPAALAIEISKPHTGVGADGLILVEPTQAADARMRIFNRDGSEGEMCGNGIRCVGKHLYDSGLCRRDVLYVETGAGIKRLEMHIQGGRALAARVNMGAPCFEPALIPVNSPSNRVLLSFGDRQAEFFCLSLGNPHAVTLELKPVPALVPEWGAHFETSSVFPRRANISFCRVIDERHLEADIWERGSGYTRACGTGATATLIAAYKMGACAEAAYVRLPGGELYIQYDENSGEAFMTGPASAVFTGEWPE